MKSKVIKITTVIFFILMTSSIFSVNNNEKPLPKVLILDFANTNNSRDYQYLKTRIPDSFSNSLSNLKKFHVLDRNIWKDEVAKGNYSNENIFNQITAINIAKKFNADIVLIGNFTEYGGQIQNVAIAIKVSNEIILVANGKLDRNRDSEILKLTDDMAFEIAQKYLQLESSADSHRLQNEINYLISHGLMKNRAQIYEKSANLSIDKRRLIYDQKSKDDLTTGGAFLLNVGLGFGIGSFYQGDNSGGLVALFGDLGSVGLIIAAFIMRDNGGNYSTAFGLFEGGGFALIGFRIFEGIRPWSYANVYNDKLSKSLRLSVAVSPYLNLAQNGNPIYGLGLTAKF